MAAGANPLDRTWPQYHQFFASSQQYFRYVRELSDSVNGMIRISASDLLPCYDVAFKTEKK